MSRSIVADDSPPSPRGEALLDQVRWRPIFVLVATIGVVMVLGRILVPLWTGVFHAAATLHRARAARQTAHALEQRLQSIDAAAIDRRLAAIEPRFLAAPNAIDAERRLRARLGPIFATMPGVVVTVTTTGEQAGILTAHATGSAPEPAWSAALLQLRRSFPQARAPQLSVRRIDMQDKPGPIAVEMTFVVPWAAA